MTVVQLSRISGRDKMSQEEFLEWKHEVETRLRILEAAVVVIQQTNMKKAEA